MTSVVQVVEIVARFLTGVGGAASCGAVLGWLLVWPAGTRQPQMRRTLYGGAALALAGGMVQLATLLVAGAGDRPRIATVLVAMAVFSVVLFFGPDLCARPLVGRWRWAGAALALALGLTMTSTAPRADLVVAIVVIRSAAAAALAGGVVTAMCLVVGAPPVDRKRRFVRVQLLTLLGAAGVIATGVLYVGVSGAGPVAWAGFVVAAVLAAAVVGLSLALRQYADRADFHLRYLQRSEHTSTGSTSERVPPRPVALAASQAVVLAGVLAMSFIALR